MVDKKEAETFQVSLKPSQGLLVSMALRHDHGFAIEVPEAFGLGGSQSSGRNGREAWRASILSLLDETYALILAVEGKDEGLVGNFLPARLKISTTRLLCSYWKIRGHELEESDTSRFLEEMTGRGFWSPEREADYVALAVLK